MSSPAVTHDEIYRAAYERYVQGVHWATFYNEVLGRHGIVRRNCPTPESLCEFEQTDAYSKIQQMLTRLREVEVQQRFHPKKKSASGSKENEEAERPEESPWVNLTRNTEPAKENNEDKDPTKVITIRIPRSVLEFLRWEANELSTSINQLCISKLLLSIDAGLIPASRPTEEKDSE